MTRLGLARRSLYNPDICTSSPQFVECLNTWVQIRQGPTDNYTTQKTSLITSREQFSR